MDVYDKRRNAAILIVFGLFISWGFGWDTVGRRLKTDVDGIIVASRDTPSTGAPRYATEYTVRSSDGNTIVFWAGPTDGSLPRSMPVGTHILKKKWHLDFERDGRREGFPYIFYGVVLTIALGLIIRGIVIIFSQKPN